MHKTEVRGDNQNTIEINSRESQLQKAARQKLDLESLYIATGFRSARPLKRLMRGSRIASTSDANSVNPSGDWKRVADCEACFRPFSAVLQLSAQATLR